MRSQRLYSKIDEMVRNASQYHGTVLADVDANHRVIQVAVDPQNVYIVPLYKRGNGDWTTYSIEGGTMYYKRESSGYYQRQAAIRFIESKRR